MICDVGFLWIFFKFSTATDRIAHGRQDFGDGGETVTSATDEGQIAAD